MFWLVYDIRAAQPGLAALRDSLQYDGDIHMRLADDAADRHPFFALWFGLYGLRGMNTGLVVTAQDQLPEHLGPNHSSSRQDQQVCFTHAFGPIGDQGINEALMRLNDHKIYAGVMNDALAVNQHGLDLRQKLGMTGRLNKWRRDLDLLGEVAERLLNASADAEEMTPDWVLAPLTPVFGEL